MIGHLAEGFVLGLATGTSCLATCGPIYAPYIMQAGRSWRSSLLVVGELSAGRFVAYLVVGALAGGFGGAIAMDQRPILTAAAYLLFSTFLIIAAIRTERKERWCAAGRWYAFVERPCLLGALTGLNLCPPFLLALARSVEHAGVGAGMFFFAAFFIGTTLFLLPLIVAGPAGKMPFLRRIARIASILVGTWFITQAGVLLYRDAVERRDTARDTRPIVNLMDSSAATIMVEDTGNIPYGLSYFVRERKGATAIIPFTSTPPDGYIFIEHPLAERQGAVEHLKRPGRFICILPPLSGDSGTVQNDARSIVRFLSTYHFRFDRDSGTVYWLPKEIQE